MKPLVCTIAGVAVVFVFAASPLAEAKGGQGGGRATSGTAAGGGGGGAAAGGGAATGGGGFGAGSGPASSSSASSGGGASHSAPSSGPSGPSGSSSGGLSSGASSSSSGSAGWRSNPTNGNSAYVRQMYGSTGDRSVPRGARQNPGAPVLGEASLRPGVNVPGIGGGNPPGGRPGGPGRPGYPGYPGNPGYYPIYGYPIGFYSSFYDPFWWWGGPWGYDYGYAYAGYGYYADAQFGQGGLKLKVEPTNAEVYVDGYYMGVVDDFDGTFQKMELETGAHHVQIRAIGYQTISFDVRIELNETITYRGELQLLSKR
jgi:hypothetical protein